MGNIIHTLYANNSCFSILILELFVVSMLQIRLICFLLIIQP